MSLKNDNKTALTMSLLLHAVVFSLLFVSFSGPAKRFVTKPGKKVDIVKAVTIDQSQVQAEIKKIQAERRAKQQATAAQKRRLKTLARAAKQKRLREQRRLKEIKRQLKLAEKKRQAKLKNYQRKLAQIKKQRAQEQKRLQQAKQRQQTLAKQRAAAAAKKRAAAIAKRRDALARQARLAQLNGVVNKYKALITQAISQRWLVPDSASKTLTCRLQIRVAPGGTVLDVKLVKSSGDPTLDRSAIQAVYKASPLPVPSDTDAFNQFRLLNLTVRPESVLSNA